MVPTTYQELVLHSLGQYRERVKQEAEEQYRERQEEQYREKQEEQAAEKKKNTTNGPSGKKDIFRPYCLKDPERKAVFPPYLIKVSKAFIPLSGTHFKSDSMPFCCTSFQAKTTKRTTPRNTQPCHLMIFVCFSQVHSTDCVARSMASTQAMSGLF